MSKRKQNKRHKRDTNNKVNDRAYVNTKNRRI